MTDARPESDPAPPSQKAGEIMPGSALLAVVGSFGFCGILALSNSATLHRADMCAAAGFLSPGSINWFVNRIWTYGNISHGGHVLAQWMRFLSANSLGFILNRGAALILSSASLYVKEIRLYRWRSARSSGSRPISIFRIGLYFVQIAPNQVRRLIVHFVIETCSPRRTSAGFSPYPFLYRIFCNSEVPHTSCLTASRETMTIKALNNTTAKLRATF